MMGREQIATKAMRNKSFWDSLQDVLDQFSVKESTFMQVLTELAHLADENWVVEVSNHELSQRTRITERHLISVRKCLEVSKIADCVSRGGMPILRDKERYIFETVTNTYRIDFNLLKKYAQENQTRN